MKSNVRRITDGAIMAALLGLLMVLDGQSGLLLDGLLFWLIPIPVIIYTVKYDLASGFMVSTAISILAFILTLPQIAILVMFSNLIGLAYGFGINKDLSKLSTLVITFVVTFGYYVISMIVFAGFFGYDAVEELKALTEFLGTIANSITGTTQDALTLLTWINPFFKMLVTFPLFLPATIALLQTIITNIISSVILKRLKLADVKVTPILSIRFDKKLGLVALVILILTYLYQIFMSTSFDNVIILVQFTMQLLFIVMGMIFSMTVISLKRIPILSIVIALLVIGMPLLIMVIGIVDVLTDIRVNMVRRAIDERKSRTA